MSAGGWEGAGNAGHSSANSPLLPRFALGRGGPGKGGGGGHRRPGRARPRCPQAVRGGLGAAGLRPETPASLTELFPSRSGPSVPVRASPCPVVVPPPQPPGCLFLLRFGPLISLRHAGQLRSCSGGGGGVVCLSVCLSLHPPLPPRTAASGSGRGRKASGLLTVATSFQCLIREFALIPDHLGGGGVKI